MPTQQLIASEETPSQGSNFAFAILTLERKSALLRSRTRARSLDDLTTLSEWFQNQIDTIAKRTGQGLLGKIGAVFITFIILCIAGMWALPEKEKILALYFGAAGAGLFGVIALVLGVLQPVLSNMDDANAWKYLKALAAFGAKNPGTISGSATPVPSPIATGQQQPLPLPKLGDQQ